ncbi:MAG: hypothetical protein R3222_08860, partial [Balneolaceae bacterium]|nr:hypothetical protein [Balneolaceae bacterium]
MNTAIASKKIFRMSQLIRKDEQYRLLIYPEEYYLYSEITGRVSPDNFSECWDFFLEEIQRMKIYHMLLESKMEYTEEISESETLQLVHDLEEAPSEINIAWINIEGTKKKWKLFARALNQKKN